MLSDEIATRQNSYNFTAFLHYLPDPDPILRKQGNDIEVYRELMYDPHISACVQSRKNGVLSMEWSIDRKEKKKTKQAGLIEEIFNDTDIYTVISEILNTPYYGFQPLEIIWKKQGKYIIPYNIIAKPPEWFTFKEADNSLLFKSRQKYDGEAVPDKKFLVPKHDATYNNPFGRRIMSSVLWPASFKKGGLKFWVVFAEKYGMPTIWAKVPRGTDTTDINKLENSLENAVQDAILVTPDDTSVEFLNADSKSANSQIYNELIQACNTEISKAILGQTLTTEQGKVGSQALGKVHADIRGDFLNTDKRLVENTFKQLISWTCELNFNDGIEPVFSLWTEEDVDIKLAERDKILSETGVKFSKQYYIKNYGFEEEDFEIVDPAAYERDIKGVDNNAGGILAGELKSELAKQFAESEKKPRFIDQQKIDNLSDSLTPGALQKQMDGVMTPIFDMVRAGADYNDVQDKLAALYPDMDIDQIQQSLAKMIFVSDLMGRASVQNEGK
jgi:phage gp29-like protein